MAKAKSVPVEVKVDPIKYGDCPEFRHSNREFGPRVPKYLNPLQLTDPNLYVNIANKLDKMTFMHIQALDGSFYAHVVVLSVIGSTVQVKVLEHYRLDDVIQEEIKMNGYLIRNTGSYSGWSITHEETGEELTSGLPTQSSCVNHLQDIFKAVKT